MFTLHVPIQLPPGHSFFDNGQYPIPPLPGGLTAHSMENDDGPLAFSVSGFATEAEAQENPNVSGGWSTVPPRWRRLLFFPEDGAA